MGIFGIGGPKEFNVQGRKDQGGGVGLVINGRPPDIEAKATKEKTKTYDTPVEIGDKKQTFFFTPADAKKIEAFRNDNDVTNFTVR